MTRHLKGILFIGLIASCLLQGNARVAFSRPGSVLRMPGVDTHENFNQYIIGFSNELLHFNDLNYASAIYFRGASPRGFNFGITYTTLPNYLEQGNKQKESSYFSFHLHKEVFRRNNIGIHLGVHDMLYDTQGPHRVSMFGMFSYTHKLKNGYSVESAFGFGTGHIAEDSHDYTESSLDTGHDFFVGLKISTPILEQNGGMKFLIEHDGEGVNVGFAIPANRAWTINLGIMHFENISKFRDWDNGALYKDAPSLALGFQMNIPKLKYKKVRSSVKGLTNYYNQMPYDEALDSLVRQATIIINALEDSLQLQHQEKQNLLATNQRLEQEANYLEDSLTVSLLDEKISEFHLNKAMKYLSNSLDAYYSHNYNLALEETNKAIEIFPDLAISYARKGSIYYRLGDIKRATINWNIALKLDPEYDEVRNILRQIKETNNILESTKLPE